MIPRIMVVGAKLWIPCLLAGLLLSAATCPAAQPASADPAVAAKLLPGDAFLFVLVKDVNALKENCKKTGFYGLYKDPAMQEFVTPAEKKVTEFIDEKLKEMWKEAGLENPPESLPWPEGRIILGMRLEMVTRQVPKIEWSDEDNKAKVVGTQESKSPEPQLVVLADMGANAEKTRTLIQQLVEKAVEKGSKRTQESVRGLDVEVVTPPPPKDSGSPDAGRTDQPFQTLAWAFKDTTLLLATDLKMLKDVAVRMSATDQESLADDKGFQNIMKRLSADQADICCFLSAKTLIRFFTEAGDPQDESRSKARKTVAALGLDNVSGLGAVANVAPNEKENVRVSLLIGVDGPKRGLLELLGPPAMSSRPAVLLTKSVSAFWAVNYDPGATCDQILKIVREVAGESEEERLRQILVLKPADENAEPLDLRKDLLGQLAGPITFLVHTTRPYSDPACQKLLFAIAVREGAALDKALGRLHAQITAGVPPEMRKDLKQELLNCNIYVLPGPNPLSRLMAGGEDDEQTTEEKNPLAFAVAGQQLVIGGLDLVRQSIRDARKGKEKAEGIETDPMYDYASKFLPAQAGSIIYGNQQTGMEIIWTQVKEAAKAAAKAAARPEGEGKSPPRGPDQRSPGAAVNPLSPMLGLVEMLKGYCDFTALPDFSAVRQYFGVEVAYILSNDDGVLIEMRNLKPPAK